VRPTVRRLPYGGRMLIAAAVCPNPPLLVPELAGGLAHELDALRAACDTAVDRLYEAGPDVLVIIGGAEGVEAEQRYQATGSFRNYGVDLRVDLGTVDLGEFVPPPPLSLLVAGWLLRERADSGVRRIAYGVGSGASKLSRLRTGFFLTKENPRMAMLVMGDGSACRSPQAPGHFDERAADYDGAVAAALASADHEVLLAVDPVLSQELQVSGWPAWQVLGAAAEASVGKHDKGYDSELLYAEAPYGVGYFVSSWTLGSQD
jgi:hypothetical protein